jgi:hypothetical protein
MGEAAKAGDDIPVRDGIAGEIIHSRGAGFGCQLAEQPDAFILDSPVLAVFQRQVEEYPVNGGQLAVSVRESAPNQSVCFACAAKPAPSSGPNQNWWIAAISCCEPGCSSTTSS